MTTNGHDRQGKNQVERTKQEETSEEVVVRRRDLAYGLREFDDRDDRKQGRIFDDRGDLPGERRQRSRYKLRSDHVADRLKAREAYCSCRFKLPFVDRKKAATHDLGDVGP